MNSRRLPLKWIYIGLMILPSSACLLRQPQEMRMGKLSSAVIKLSANVESTVRYTDNPANISEPELLARSTEHDPGILKFFSRYSIQIIHNDKDAVILVCTKDRKRALFEDAGCTAKLDTILWKNKPPSKCAFGATVEAACPNK
jgi:hypothetical protein